MELPGQSLTGSPTTPSPTNSNGSKPPTIPRSSGPNPRRRGGPRRRPAGADALGSIRSLDAPAPLKGPDEPPTQPGCFLQTQPLIPRGQYPALAAAVDWPKANDHHSTPGNFVGNVAADIAATPWDVPAGLTNAIIHTAQTYGVNPAAPSFPMAAPRIKADLGVTPITDPWGQRAETAAQMWLNA